MHVHAEAVAALCVHVELHGFFGFAPFFVEGDAIGREAKIVVRGSNDEHGRGVGRNGGVFEPAGGSVDWSDERGLAVWRVVEGGAGGDCSPGGKTDDADAVGRNAPLGGVSANVSNSSLAIGDGERNDFAYDLAELLPIVEKIGEFLG